jgi:hypothetical protein
MEELPQTPIINVELPPTKETYSELQQAYEYFNQILFENKLPHCLLTLQRGHPTFGYFCHERFTRHDGAATTDEIALNPRFFQSSS